MTTIYFDLETGGVLPEQPSIQLAAIAVDDKWNELACFEQKIKFNESDCDPKALEINHYTADAWKGAIEPIQVARNFAAFVRPHSGIEMISKRTGRPYNVARLAGYNALTFDLPRLRALFGDEFFPCSYHVRDILQRAMFFFDENPEQPKPKDLKLTTLAEHFEIPTDGAHDALTDVRLTISVACNMAYINRNGKSQMREATKR